MIKPYSEACDRNREPILSVIKPLLSSAYTVLEIGSGTGQHAVYFAEKMPHVMWQTSDRQENLADIQIWLDEAGLTNTPSPLLLDVSSGPWPNDRFDAVFSANTVHIMSWAAVQHLFDGVGGVLARGGQLMLYGPFNYNNRYTSDSNRQFDAWLKNRDPLSGIRDFEELAGLADRAGMALQADYEMPANNRILCWQKK